MKDYFGKNIYLFDDGTLKALNSSDFVQSRFRIKIVNETEVSFSNGSDYLLNAESMKWEKETEDKAVFQFEQLGNFVTFKSLNNKYLTVNSDGILKFDSETVSENTKFYINKECDQGRLHLSFNI